MEETHKKNRKVVRQGKCDKRMNREASLEKVARRPGLEIIGDAQKSSHLESFRRRPSN